MKPKLPQRSARRLSLAAGLLAITGSLAAQTDAPPPGEEPVVLSPFEVNTNRDVGYLAQNTLAGSRLNTNLRDVGAAISVLTPEFLADIGATNMRDVILFENNAVPDLGDAASNFNGNPVVGNNEWQLRIRGLPASYARNYFAWVTSTDFYNVDRIDQARGPNSILFGFGSAGGIVNTTTKQAQVGKDATEITALVGSWSRRRGTIDVNHVIIPNKFAVRLNAMAEDGKSWREFEFDRARRAHLTTTYRPTKTSSLRVEGEIGRIKDNVARPWLMVDQSFLWRNAGRPTYTGQWPSGPTIATFWPDHLVVADDGVVRNWLGHAYGSNSTASQTWSQLAFTPENLAMIPMNSNPAGPDAVRRTRYDTESAFYDVDVTDRLSLEFAANHQATDFLGYDANGSRATNYFGDSSELWGDASADLPDGTPNPNKGKLYLENNWTRRHLTDKTTHGRVSAAYKFETGSWANHRVAALYEHSQRDYFLDEDAEVFTAMPYDNTAAEADVNRVYRRHYFTPGDASDIHVGSWRDVLLGTGWAPDQYLDNAREKQDTLLGALQSFFFSDQLVTTLGFRSDTMNYSWVPSVRDAVTKQWRLDNTRNSTRFDASTFTVGAVYHILKQVSVYANHSNSRDIPNVHIHVIGADIPPMPRGEGNDVGLKLDLLDGKLYATAGYYTTKVEHMTDWGDIQTAFTDLNTRVLTALRTAGLITQADQNARTINANGFMQDRKAQGWEFSLIANPTKNWRISANFSTNKVINENAMAEVKTWADENTAYWLAKGGSNFLLSGPGNAWDTIGAQVGWMYQYHIDNVTALNGLQARGERKYGANLYTKYTFDSGVLKGLAIGGGGRYQSANVLGFYNGDVRMGRSLELADAMLAYTIDTRLFGDHTPLELQLNVSNLFDTRRYQIYTLAWWDTTSSIPERIGLQEPRKFTFSASIKF
jgi:outer membrane receptor protein involved in Fe transport